MCPSRLLSAALLVAAGLTPASAADLTKIDRTLKDEPKYTTPTPKYCLLAFGPEAKTHVWLVLDGDLIHVRASLDGKAPRNGGSSRRPSSLPLGDVWEEGGKSPQELRYSPAPEPDAAGPRRRQTQVAARTHAAK